MKPRIDAPRQMALVVRNAEMLNAAFHGLKANPGSLKKMFGRGDEALPAGFPIHQYL